MKLFVKNSNLACLAIILFGAIATISAYQYQMNTKKEAHIQQIKQENILEITKIQQNMNRKAAFLEFLERHFAASNLVSEDEFIEFSSFALEKFGLNAICWNSSQSNIRYAIGSRADLCSEFSILEPNQVLKTKDYQVMVSEYCQSKSKQRGYISIIFDPSSLFSLEKSFSDYFVVGTDLDTQSITFLKFDKGKAIETSSDLSPSNLNSLYEILTFPGFRLDVFFMHQPSNIKLSLIEFGFITSIFCIFCIIAVYIRELLEKKNQIMIEVMAKTYDLKSSNQAFKEAKELAEKATRHKSLFLANMSHEIRTPLNGIVGTVALLEDEVTSPRLKKKIRTVTSSCETLLTIINDILDISKLSAGKVDLESRAFNLKQTMQDIGDLFFNIASEKDLSLIVELPSDDIFVKGDEVRVKQIVSNLVSNSIKFTSEGQVILRLKVLHDPWYKIDVIDTGIGISEDQQSKLFETFSQVDASTTRLYGGTGLGLSIVKMITELLGGKISVTSRIGKGSEFSIELPLAKSERKVSVEVEPNQKFDGKIKVLVTDDNEINRDVAEGFLVKWFSIHPDIATNGKEALDLARNRPYDLILMDCHMPIMDGFESTRIIKANPEQYGAPLVVALTASVMSEDIARIKLVGMDDVIDKPLKRKKFEKVLLRFFPKHFEKTRFYEN